MVLSIARLIYKKRHLHAVLHWYTEKQKADKVFYLHKLLFYAASYLLASKINGEFFTGIILLASGQQYYCSSVLTLLVSSQDETRQLLSPIEAPSMRKRISQACVSPTHLCLPSKAAILILIWSAIVGAMNTMGMDTTFAVGVALKEVEFFGQKFNNILLNVLVPYLYAALVMLLYPLSGFVADIWCGFKPNLN